MSHQSFDFFLQRNHIHVFQASLLQLKHFEILTVGRERCTSDASTMMFDDFRPLEYTHNGLIYLWL